MSDTDTSELEMNLRNILNDKFTGGKKRRSRKGSKGSKKSSRKQTGGKRRSTRKTSRKGSRKASKKGSRKGSRKQSGGALHMWGSKKGSKKVTGGKKRRSRKSTKTSRKSTKGSRKSTKGSRKGSRRGLPPAMVAFGKIRAHIMKKLGVKMTVALQIAKQVRDEVMKKHPSVTDHDDIAKKSIEHFNSNESKFSAKASRM